MYKKIIYFILPFYISLIATASQKPNIIFFIADDMLPVHFNCLSEGKDKYFTPNIDRLANEGVLMLEQHVVSPVCTPSRYSVLTGLYPSRATNGGFITRTKKEGQTVVQFNTDIVKGNKTIGSRLQKAGYVTGFVGKNHVVQVHNLKKFSNYDASAQDPIIKKQLIDNHTKIKSDLFDRITYFSMIIS